MTAQGCLWNRHSGDNDREIAHSGMQPNQVAKIATLGAPHSWEGDWWPVGSVLEQENHQHEAIPCRADVGSCSLELRANNERQLGNLARIGRLLSDYQQENVGSESGWWTSESSSRGAPLSSVTSQTDRHDVGSRPQRCCLSRLGHSEIALDMTEPSIVGETFSIRNSTLDPHGTDDFGQDVWETCSGREYSWCSPLALPYSVFGEPISQCYGPNNQSSSNGWRGQKQADGSDGQSIKIEPLSRLDGLYAPSSCGNWMDDLVAVGQHYCDPAETFITSPGPLGGFLDPPVRCLGLLENSLYPGPVSIGEFSSDNDGKIPPPSSHHGPNISSQLTDSSKKAAFVAAESCSNCHSGTCFGIKWTPHDPLSVSQRLGGQTTNCARLEAQHHQQSHALKQTSSRPLVPRPIHPGLPIGEHSSLESRPALTRRSRNRKKLSTRAAQRRVMKDQFLIDSKLAGMSYKEIREKGDFSEPESTLRGRYRTLTKDKRQRVRRPEWEEEDIRLLQRAVEDLTASLGKAQILRPRANKNVKIPWKQVAEYIAEHGGSYHFGNSTCRKKWEETRNRGLTDSPLESNAEQR
ncbi:MAG: hypothetical protein M1813_001524 [Trichoglossum hirsutum]|nr:MAG: hypothetical protein M1813_001524 [Trichoglossum hirsutum]